MNHLNENEQAMRARCDAATKGPWVKRHHDWESSSYQVSTAHGASRQRERVYVCEGATSMNSANCEFIAHARQDLPACLDTIEKLRGELAEAQALLNSVLAYFGPTRPCLLDTDIRAFLAKHKEPNDGNK